jgi:hypothetical protein
VSVSTGTAVGTGKQNTLNIVEVVAGLGETGTAAQLCVAWSYNGLTNWFLPSNAELTAMWAQRSNNGLVTGAYYASSSQSSAEKGYYMYNGSLMTGGNKSQPRTVRAVRYFL